MTLALTDDGLEIETLDEIRTALQLAYTDPVTGISPLLDVGDDSVFGREIGILAERERSLQEQILAVYTALGVDSTGVALTKVALLTGTVRSDATYSAVEVTLSLNAGVTVPAGSRINVAGDPNLVFETNTAVTNGGGTPATFDVETTALNPGPVRAPAGTLTAIQSPVVGWTAVTNTFDAEEGAVAETDPQLRTRRIQELNRAASANLAAIVTDVRAVSQVEDARGYENTTAATDSDGLPAHSFEIVVYAPLADDDEIAQAIWDAQPAGIGAVHGTAGDARTGIATDVLGDDHTITYTDAEILNIFMNAVLTVDDDVYPDDGDAQVKQALYDYINGINQIGEDIVITRLYAPIYSVAGVLDVTLIQIGEIGGPPASVNLVVGSREVARIQLSAVGVASP